MRNEVLYQCSDRKSIPSPWVENGKRFESREQFQPVLYVKSKKKTKYKTLAGDSVEPIQPGSVRDCREFIKKYDEVPGFEIYGNDRYIYQYISEHYPEENLEFDAKQIKLVTIDIETASEYGFPDVESCSEEILAITIQIILRRKLLPGDKNLLGMIVMMLPIITVQQKGIAFKFS